MSRKNILYRGKEFGDSDVVKGFLREHRIINSAMLGTRNTGYLDPCTCCIPASGERDLKPDIATLEEVLAYIQDSQ